MNPLIHASPAVDPTAVLAPFIQTAASAAVLGGNPGTEATLIGSGVGSLTFPAGFFVPGRSLRVFAGGVFSSDTSGGGSPTLEFRLKFGSTSLVLASIALDPFVILTNKGWQLVALITCRQAGSVATMMVEGYVLLDGEVISAGGAFRLAGYTPFARTSANNVNTAIAQTFNLTARWQIADAALQSITGHVCAVETLR